MKRFLAFMTALVILSACFACLNLPVLAGEKTVGEVLYHQDFSVLSDLEKSGILRGTSSSENSLFTCADKVLELNTYDNDRIYAILPATETGDSYTIEFDFSFSEVRSDNGYIGFILTCRGTEPTNVTALVIRADGTIDDFEEPDEALKKKIGSEPVHVKIPIEKNVLHKIELTVGGTSCTLERDSVKVLDDGEMGFVVRNASVDVTEIYLVNGTGYSEMSGIYAAGSYAKDEVSATLELLPSQTKAEYEASAETAPDTGDFMVPYAAVLTAGIMGLFHRFTAGKRRTYR